MRDVVENTPKLRFPGFSGEWKPMPVGDFATFQRGFDLPNQSRIEGDVPIVSSGGVSGFHNEARVERAGLVTGRYGSIGELFYLDGPHWPLNTSLWVKDFHGNEIKFAYYLLSRIDFRSLSDKTGVPGVNRNDVHKLQTAKPKLPEQQKIAAFLGAVDEKIGQLTRKKALLEDYKKGCMQQLFTQKLRFKDDQGNDFPDWDTTKLEDIVTIKKGTQLNRDDMIQEGAFPVINGGVTASGYTNSFNAPGGSITISEGGNSCGHVAWQSRDFWLGGHCYVVSANDQKSVLTKFLFHSLRHNQAKIMRLRVGSGLPNIQKGDLLQLTLGIPQPDEQQKIADFLSAIDAKISLVAEELSAAQDFKKGLLQQMFV